MFSREGTISSLCIHKKKNKLNKKKQNVMPHTKLILYIYL